MQRALQGAQLAGHGCPGVGLGVEGAPLTLLEGITAFLSQQRASLRQEAQAVLAARMTTLAPGAFPMVDELLAFLCVQICR